MSVESLRSARSCGGGWAGERQLTSLAVWVQRVAMRRLRTGGSQRALLVGAGGTAKAAMYALSKVKGIERPVLLYNRTTSRAEALAAEFGAQVVTRLDNLEDVGVIVSTIPPEGATVIPDALLANKPIMLDASYMPGGAPLTKRATAAGCDLIVGPHMLFEQATYQVGLFTNRALLFWHSWSTHPPRSS